MSARQRTGVVAEFDERRGIGLVVAEDGGRYGFHCTAIVDGSRTIEQGAAVSFGVRAGPLGRDEATDLEPARSS